MAFVVLLSHFDNVYSNLLIASTYKTFQYAGYFISNVYDGTEAVITFFIISGFVIHYPNKNSITNLKEFWVRRFLRILLPLIAICIIGIYKHPERLIWSLACELSYYAMYPLLIKISLTWRNKFLMAYLISILLIVIGAHNDVNASIKQTDLHFHGYYWQLGIVLTAIVGLPCWLLGVLIAENIDNLKNTSFLKLMAYRLCVILLGYAGNLLKLQYHTNYILTMNIIALLLYKWIQTEIIYYKTKQPNAILERMGKFSYSLYICHPIIYLALLNFMPYNTVTYPLYLLINVGLSYCFYLLIEKPTHKLARNIKMSDKTKHAI